MAIKKNNFVNRFSPEFEQAILQHKQFNEKEYWEQEEELREWHLKQKKEKQEDK